MEKEDREELEQRFLQIDEAIIELRARASALQSVTGILATVLVRQYPFVKDYILRILEAPPPPPDMDPSAFEVQSYRRAFEEMREVFNKGLSKVSESTE